MLPNRMTGSWITLPTDALRIYFNLCIIKYFLNIISPNNDMMAMVVAFIAATALALAMTLSMLSIINNVQDIMRMQGKGASST